MSVLRRAMNVRPVSQCRLLAAEVAWSKPAECHLVALWKLRQNDFSTPDPNHPNIETGWHPSFAPSQPASIERFCRELNAQSESRCCVLFYVPRLSNTFFLSFSQLEIVLPNLPYPYLEPEHAKQDQPTCLGVQIFMLCFKQFCEFRTIV